MHSSYKMLIFLLVFAGCKNADQFKRIHVTGHSSVFQVYSGQHCVIEDVSGKHRFKINCETIKEFIDPRGPACQNARFKPRLSYFPSGKKPLRLCQYLLDTDYSSQKEVNFVVIGDIGTGQDVGKNYYQKSVAQGLAKVCEKSGNLGLGCDFVLVTGDLVYPSGVTDLWDKNFDDLFENIYNDMGEKIYFFAALGNHDYRGNKQAMKEYSFVSSRWRLPSEYYAIPSLPSWLNIGVIDTQSMEGDHDTTPDWEKQQQMLESSVCSKEGWKIIAGHYPMMSKGDHKSHAGMMKKLTTFREKCKFQLYASGHDHHLELSESEGFFSLVSGAGGKVSGEVEKMQNAYEMQIGDRSLLVNQLYASPNHGFVHINAKPESLTIKFFEINESSKKSGDLALSSTFSCTIAEGSSTCQ